MPDELVAEIARAGALAAGDERGHRQDARRSAPLAGNTSCGQREFEAEGAGHGTSVPESRGQSISSGTRTSPGAAGV